MTRLAVLAVAGALTFAAACHRAPVSTDLRASGYVEATEVRVGAKTGGRVATARAVEGQRVEAGQVVATIDTTDLDISLKRAEADRNQAQAQLQLLRDGSRPEDIQQAQAQVSAAQSDQRAADAELTAAKADETRYRQLLDAHAGAEKPYTDAVSRRQAAEAHVAAAADRTRAAAQQLARLQAGARPQEIDAAAAHVAAANAQIAALQQQIADATITAPSGGVVTSRLVEPGEIVAPGAPVFVIVDLDHAWANVYVDEPLIPALKVGQSADVITDAGNHLAGHIGFISPQAEFTPRNVQTADERAKLVYRVKVLVDNSAGVLKPGMPVTADFGAAR